MKILLSTILLISFLANPLAKISVVSYYKLNINTIVDKYCVNKNKPELKCNGKCYLKKQLEFSTTKTESNQFKTVNLAESFIPVFFENKNFDFNHNIQSKELKHTFFYKIHKRTINFSIPIENPPELA